MPDKRKKAFSSKKKYSPPEITSYGNFKKITQAKGSGSNDGGGKPTTKTSGANS